MEIEKVIENRQRNVVIKPAHYKEMDTGQKQVVTVILEDGSKVEEERPLMKRVYVEPEKKIVEDTVTIYKVNDGIDVHEFSTLKDARSFVKGSQ